MEHRARYLELVLLFIGLHHVRSHGRWLRSLVFGFALFDCRFVDAGLWFAVGLLLGQVRRLMMKAAKP